MKFRIATFLFFLSVHGLFATKVDRGFRALEKQNYQKAAEIFHSVTKDEKISAAANYGLALVYSSRDFTNYHIDKAYGHLIKAIHQFNDKSLDNRQDLQSQKISYQKLLSLKAGIEDKILRTYIDSGSVAALNAYLEIFSDASNRGRAASIRNQLAFDSVLTANTVEAYTYFIESFPKAVQMDKVKELRDQLAYTAFLEEKARMVQLQRQRDSLEKLQLEYKQQMTEAETKRVKRENSLHAQRNTLLTIALVVAGLMLAFVAYSYHQKKKANAEIKKQNEMIESKNKQILDSINYAKRIQDAILPEMAGIKKYFKDLFILYNPRDIVSGDFYWFAETEDKVYLAAVDCTGHGVPGAFMSMIGNSLLNQTVHVENKSTPADILFNLRKEVISALHQTGGKKENKDGMDMALLAFHKDMKKVEFSGAFNPLYLVREGELQIFKGDRQPIASYYGKEKNQFNNYELDLQEGDAMYVFTDGYADQFGGTEDKKFSYKRMRTLLADNYHLPAPEQQKILESNIKEWMNGRQQIDDILVIGVKI